MLENELSAVPLAHWGYFFPCHVAVWKFIEEFRPGVLGGLQAGYDNEPYFRGRGSLWFCDSLGNNEAYLDLIERLMYSMVRDLMPETMARGFLLRTEVPRIDDATMQSLSELVLKAVDEAVSSGELSR